MIFVVALMPTDFLCDSYADSKNTDFDINANKIEN